MRMYLLDVFLNTSGDATANPANFTLPLHEAWVSVFSSVSVQ